MTAPTRHSQLLDGRPSSITTPGLIGVTSRNSSATEASNFLAHIDKAESADSKAPIQGASRHEDADEQEKYISKGTANHYGTNHSQTVSKSCNRQTPLVATCKISEKLKPGKQEQLPSLASSEYTAHRKTGWIGISKPRLHP